jgi:hypothetical protein
MSNTVYSLKNRILMFIFLAILIFLNHFIKVVSFEFFLFKYKRLINYKNSIILSKKKAVSFILNLIFD